MSSSLYREPPSGMLLQNGQIVGHVELPAAIEEFIDAFNHEYHRLGLTACRDPDEPLGPINDA